MFFLYLILCSLATVSLNAQTSDSQPDQDSIDYYLQVVKEGENQVGRALAKIGYLYEKAGRFNSALSYFDRAYPLLNGEGKSLEAARIDRTKGHIYESFGDKAESVKYYSLARASYLKAAGIYEEIGSRSQQMSVNQNLADIATKRRNFNRAVFYQNKVIKSLTQLYHDSLQRQAESFNDLLNKEVESSKDTIYIEPSNLTSPMKNTGPNWLYGALILATLALMGAAFGWLVHSRKSKDLSEDLSNLKANKRQLQKQHEELQELNIALAKTEKAQRKSNMTKDKLFSIIAHDLRSPINTISGFLNILGNKLSSIGDIELRSLSQEMIDSTDRLSHFLDDLLKWSMSQLGQIKPNEQRIDVKKLIEENYLLVKSRLLSKNIHFKASVPTNVNVYADVNMFRVILRNLISNAIKFTRQDGYISVSLKPGNEGMTVIEIADDGIGMSEEKLQGIFEFTASEINGGTSNEGAGLGLLLCKEFAEINGGSIEVKSKLGEGTCFTIRLPDHPTMESATG